MTEQGAYSRGLFRWDRGVAMLDPILPPHVSEEDAAAMEQPRAVRSPSVHDVASATGLGPPSPATGPMIDASGRVIFADAGGEEDAGPGELDGEDEVAGSPFGYQVGHCQDREAQTSEIMRWRGTHDSARRPSCGIVLPVVHRPGRRVRAVSTSDVCHRNVSAGYSKHTCMFK